MTFRIIELSFSNTEYGDEMMDEKGKVKSLSKAIDLLDILCTARRGLSLSELSERSGYPKSTTHALASTLRDRGLLRQLQNGDYALGLRLFEYGSAVSRGFDISELSRPYLESLSSLTGANSVISLLDGESAVSFDYAVSSSGVQILPEIGNPHISVVVCSFGYKRGVPVDADIVLDMRFAENPYYVPELKQLSGLDQPVIDFRSACIG